MCFLKIKNINIRYLGFEKQTDTQLKENPFKHRNLREHR